MTKLLESPRCRQRSRRAAGAGTRRRQAPPMPAPRLPKTPVQPAHLPPPPAPPPLTVLPLPHRPPRHRESSARGQRLSACGQVGDRRASGVDQGHAGLTGTCGHSGARYSLSPPPLPGCHGRCRAFAMVGARACLSNATRRRACRGRQHRQAGRFRPHPRVAPSLGRSDPRACRSRHAYINECGNFDARSAEVDAFWARARAGARARLGQDADAKARFACSISAQGS